MKTGFGRLGDLIPVKMGREIWNLAEVRPAPTMKAMLDAYPNLRGMYDEQDGNTQVFYMKNAVAGTSYFWKSFFGFCS